MQTMAVIKKDLDFNRGLSSLIEVLKNIAVSQFRSLEHKFHAFDKLTQAIESFFEFITRNRGPAPVKNLFFKIIIHPVYLPADMQFLIAVFWAV